MRALWLGIITILVCLSVSLGCSSELQNLSARVCQIDTDCPSTLCIEGFCALERDSQEDARPFDFGSNASSDTPVDTSSDTPADMSPDMPLDTLPDTPPMVSACALDHDCELGEYCDLTTYECSDIAVSGGQFTDSEQLLGFVQSEGVALGDLDGDGDLDAFVGNDRFISDNSGANKVYLNDGEGVFSDAGLELGTFRTHAVAVGDLNGDGALDAFSANLLEPDRVYLNDGEGHFTGTDQELGMSNSRDVALGDIDGDGDLDAFVVNFDEPDNVWINDGDGVFLKSEQELGIGFSEGVALGDVDGDGDLDAVIANELGQSNRVWVNDGDGNFTMSSQALGAFNSHAVALGDVDNDGDLDALIVNGLSGPDRPLEPSRVYLNDGDGTFNDSGEMLADNADDFNVEVVLADLDGDGDLDVFLAGEGSANTIFMNDGNGSFTSSSQRLGSGSTNDVAAGDMDGDGDLDIFCGNIGEPNRVWINN